VGDEQSLSDSRLFGVDFAAGENDVEIFRLGLLSGDWGSTFSGEEVGGVISDPVEAGADSSVRWFVLKISGLLLRERLVSGDKGVLELQGEGVGIVVAVS
jgi:hypothetical protein